MFLTPTNILIILSGLAITWSVLFSLFNEKSSLHRGLKLGILVLALSPFIAKFSYNSYAMLSRQWFLMNANGEIQLPYSPLKIHPTKNKDYCDQFKDSKGNPLNSVSISDDGKGYCGDFWGFYEQSPIFLPYKLLDNNKAIYWTSPELRIIGPIPEHLLVKNMAKNANISSGKPNRIYVKEGQMTRIIVIKQFDLSSSDNQKKKTISAGTVLSGFTLKPFSVSDKPSQVNFKLIVGSTSCTASSDTQIKPDYTTATAIAKIISMNCSNDESKSVAVEAIALISGRVLYSRDA